MGILEGNLVLLRPIEKSDIEVLNRWKNDEEIYKYLGGGFQPISIDQQEKWLDSMIDLTGNNRRFMIETEEHHIIGMVGLYNINWIHRTCEIGMYIGETDMHGKGYGSEACEIIEDYALRYLNLRKINLKVVGDNGLGREFWLKMGYKLIGTMTKERYINGEYCDVLLMEKFLRGGA